MQLSRNLLLGAAGGAILVLAAGGMLVAQGEAPGASAVPIAAGNFEVGGVTVDVRGKDAEGARQGGWRLAQRKGWEMLSQRLTGKKQSLPDGTLDGLVKGIVVQQEQIGPNRYIATLGVLYDRARAGAILGVSTAVTRSQPILLVPLQFSGGVGQVFERETGWARAWNRFRAAGSTIDYVRLRGNGPDALLVDAGQTLRRGRNWWRTILDQYGASDVIVAEVQLRREYPGGPIVGVFSANHGPDRRPVAGFALRVGNSDSLDALLDAGVQRLDVELQKALASGLLHGDPTLAVRVPKPQAPIEDDADTQGAEEVPLDEGGPTASTTLTVQVDTPTAAAVTASEVALRGVPGVTSAATSSLALGGVSVMRVTFDGPIASLRAQLEARGWQVQEGAGVLRIRRAAGSGAAAPGANAGPPIPAPQPQGAPNGE